MLELAECSIELRVGLYVKSYAHFLRRRFHRGVDWLGDKAVPVTLVMDLYGYMLCLYSGNVCYSYNIIKVMFKIDLILPRREGGRKSAFVHALILYPVDGEILNYSLAAVLMAEVVIPSEKEPPAIVLLEIIRLEEENAFFFKPCHICYLERLLVAYIIEVAAQLVKTGQEFVRFD